MAFTWWSQSRNRTSLRSLRSPRERPARARPYGGREGGSVSKGKKFVALSLMTFIGLIVIGALWGHHSPADPTGPGFNGLANYPSTTANVPVSQAGVNELASQGG